MPFTFSHPIAVLPLKRLQLIKFSFTGLFFGSIAPDMEYFLRMRLETTISETVIGFFLFNLPITILTALIFHLLIRNILIINLPRPLDQNYARALKFDFIEYLTRHWLIFLISCAVGILSHHLLDFIFDIKENPERGFTTIDLYTLPAFITRRSMKLAEMLFSLVALAFLLYYFLSSKEYKYKGYVPLQNSKKFWFWGRIILLTAAIAVVRITTSIYIFRAGAIITVLISGIMISLIVIAIYDLLLKKKPA